MHVSRTALCSVRPSPSVIGAGAFFGIRAAGRLMPRRVGLFALFCAVPPFAADCAAGLTVRTDPRGEVWINEQPAHRLWRPVL